jgi:hypothetical protein
LPSQDVGTVLQLSFWWGRAMAPAEPPSVLTKP